MGGKKTNAQPAEKKSLCAHMANADISAKTVRGRDIVSMGVSGTIAGTAAGSLYVCMDASLISATFAAKNVLMAKIAVDAISVK
jgi:hypothetical protein